MGRRPGIERGGATERRGRSRPLNIATPLLEVPEIVAANASGRLNGAQRRALARDFYGEHWRTPVASLGWIAISLVMLRIFFPVVRDIVPRLFAVAGQGSVPVAFGRFTVSLPLWGLLQWGLLLGGGNREGHRPRL